MRLMHLERDDSLPGVRLCIRLARATKIVIQKPGGSTLTVYEIATQDMFDLPRGTYVGTFPDTIS